jgi:succinylarginine dihydrolase
MDSEVGAVEVPAVTPAADATAVRHVRAGGEVEPLGLEEAVTDHGEPEHLATQDEVMPDRRTRHVLDHPRAASRAHRLAALRG